jgi:glycosyltransferase involved in cell wall biosynthesis
MAPALGSILRIIKKRHVQAKIIGLIDNIIPHEKRVGDRILARYYTNACDGFVVMSRSVEEEMKTFTNNTVIYNPHPIYDIYGEKVAREEALQRLQLPENQRYILFFGLVRKYKGLDLLLEAFAFLKKQNAVLNKTIKLIIAGEFYEDEKLYRDLIKTLDIDNQVIIRAEYIPNDEVKYYFGAADLVVQPYRKATQSGISQIAYHFEKPMIVSNVGGLPEIVAHGKAGYVIKPTPQLIADAITDFYKNNRNEVFIKEVVEKKKCFSWEALTNTFLSFIKS